MIYPLRNIREPILFEKDWKNERMAKNLSSNLPALNVTTTYLINSWRALKTGFQNPVGAISESRPVGNRRSLLQRESIHNEPTNPIYEIRSNSVVAA